MKNKKIRLHRNLMVGAIMLSSLLSAGNAWAAVDPCEMNTSMTSGQTAQNGGTHPIDGGFNYEMWTNSGNNASMQYRAEDGMFQFKANWNNPDDLLCRIGLYWGTGPKPSELDGDLHCDFNYDFSGTGGGYNYIGIYGWTKTPNEVEYYIVENTFFGSTQQQQGLYYGASKRTSYTIEGEGTYDLWIGTRTNAPSISGTSTFTQVFAVRTSPRKCGHISISEHMRHWDGYVTLGQLYDCKFLCEVGKGSGSFDMKYGNVWIGDATQTPPEPEVPQGPYKTAIAIPGTLEAEHYDVGGNGFAYKDSDKKNEGDAKFRTDEGVDIVVAGSGMAVGYTSSSEWLEYTVDVAETSKYDVVATASDGNQAIKFDLYCDDKKIASFSGSQTADWDTYTELTETTSEITAGEHILKIKFENDNINIDNLKFYKAGEVPQDTTTVNPITPVEPGSTTTTSGSFFDENGAYYGPDCDATNYTGAYYTGDYTSPFATILGKSESDIQKKLDELWNHYFVSSNKVYYEGSNGEAYILDTGNNDVRSEGMSYGMMICVQTNHKDEFAKIWKWAKNHMWHNPNSGGDGYFSWSCGTDGSVKDRGCAPDGEMYFMTSLLLAANRWNDSGYRADAQAILKSCWKGNYQSLFNESTKIVTFQPSQGNSDFSDPSYSLPAFVELFARWSDTNNDKWNQAVSATRDHLYKSCNTTSGLFSDYNNFDGTPKSVNFNSNATKYMYDAMRCAMNYGMDYYLFGKDAKRQTEMAKRIIDFFEKDGYSHGRFNWDGSGPSESYTLGETGANAVACYALMNEPSYEKQVKTNLNKAWSAGLATGQYRYYDGLVHYLSMLHLCGSFKIWKPAPTIIEKTVNNMEYNGVTYTEETTINSFEDCQLYKVTIKPSQELSEIDEEVADNSVVLMPNPTKNYFEIKSAQKVESIIVLNMVGQIVYNQNNAERIEINLPAGTYMVKVLTADGNCSTLKLIVK